MPIWYEQKPNCFVICVEEPDLTEGLLDPMRQILTIAFLRQQYNIIFDLSQCKMIDSYFIGLLISTYRELRDLGGTIKYANVSGHIAHAFEVIRLNQIMEIHDSVEHAVESFSPKITAPLDKSTTS